MLFYEINLLISPNFSEAEISSFIDKIEGELQNNGKIVSDKKAERKKLAYDVEEQNEAWFYFLGLYPEKTDKKEMLDSIEKMLKEDKDILRFLIIKKDSRKKEIRAKAERTTEGKKEETEETKTEESETPAVEEKPKKHKAQLEEIDEKLNEMLGE